MKYINYKDYFDKVYGCWLGKCVSGTIGAPYEGMKELLDIEFDPIMIKSNIANDDLDLQVLWLDVLEKKGVDITSEDLAEAFHNRCSYAPAEYGIFKKNFARGIHPPLCGEFNNRLYFDGMGCPIRSEIWACISPGNPELAAEFAERDGVLDHVGNSVYAEQFFAGLESAAFFESDLDALIEIGIRLIPADSKIVRLISDVREWCKSDCDWKYIRSNIIRHYGHPDCTNLYQNIGFTLLALYHGELDFMKTTMLALNCGFDTDCTCATAGAILGIIHGAKKLIDKHNLADQGYRVDIVDVQRRSQNILDLAEDTCLMGIYFAKHINNTIIDNAPQAPIIELAKRNPVEIVAKYEGIPAIGIGDTRRVNLFFKNRSNKELCGTASIKLPDGWSCGDENAELVIAPNESGSWAVDISVPKDLEILNEVNIIQTNFIWDTGSAVFEFGLAGASVWQVYGPFWENSIKIPALKPGESYFSHITGEDENDLLDNQRTYHLNTRVDMQKEYLTLQELISEAYVEGDAARKPELVNIYEDLFSVNDLVGFQGPCVVYLVRKMISPEDRKVGIQVGHTDAYSLWINGELVSKRDNVDWWTYENAHVLGYPINKGANTIVMKLVRRTNKSDFSLTFLEGGLCPPQYFDHASINPIYHSLSAVSSMRSSL